MIMVLTCGHEVQNDPDLRMVDDFKRVWWRCRVQGRFLGRLIWDFFREYK
jgi:hypothetical protein